MENINNTIIPEIPVQPIETPILTPTPPRSNLFKYLFIICLIVLLVVTISFIFIFSNKNTNQPPIQQNTNDVSEVIPTIIPTNEVINKVTPISELDSKTAQWKTYKSEKYGFEFKYPKELVVSPISKENSITLSNSDDGHWVYNISIESNINNLTLENIFDNKLNQISKSMATENKILNKTESTSNLLVDGKTAKKYLISNYGDYGNTGVITVNNGNILSISGTVTANDPNDKEFELVVSTIKFTN